VAEDLIIHVEKALRSREDEFRPVGNTSAACIPPASQMSIFSREIPVFKRGIQNSDPY
jgi:hypothetical protein